MRSSLLGILRATAVLALVLLGACGTEDVVTTEDGPKVELGTGVTTFVPIRDGDALELVAGSQGGWHIDVTTRLFGVRASELPDVLLRYETRRAGERVSLRAEVQLSERRVFEEIPDQQYVRLGDFVQFDINGPLDVVGDTFDVTLTAEIGDLVLTDTRTIVVVDNDRTE